MAIIEEPIIDLLTNKIREYRFRNGEMTQKALAGRVGVSRQTMNAIENGRHSPTIAVAIRMADVFSVSVDQLFELEYEGKPAHRVQATRVAVNRSRTTTEKPIKIESKHEPIEEESTGQVSLASLRGVVG